VTNWSRRCRVELYITVSVVTTVRSLAIFFSFRASGFAPVPCTAYKCRTVRHVMTYAILYCRALNRRLLDYDTERIPNSESPITPTEKQILIRRLAEPLRDRNRNFKYFTSRNPGTGSPKRRKSKKAKPKTPKSRSTNDTGRLLADFRHFQFSREFSV
jgi:hypothetical protein